MRFISNEYWDIGKRPINEDSLLVAHVDTKIGQIIMCAVADGIGSLSLGEVASGYVLEELAECFYEELVPIILSKKGKTRIIRCVRKRLFVINQNLRTYADGKGITMGSTLSLILLFKKKYIFVQLGDSGIIRCDENGMELISRKHIFSGGQINKCIGSFGYMEPDIEWGKTKPMTGFLIATDGYYKGIKLDSEFWNPHRMISERIIGKRLLEMGKVALKTQTDNAGAIYINCI